MWKAMCFGAGRRGAMWARVAMAAAVMTTGASVHADDILLFPMSVPDAAGWEREHLAAGPPGPGCSVGCPCGETNAALSRNESNVEWLIGYQFRREDGSPFAMPPGHRIVEVRLNVHARYQPGLGRVRVEANLPNGQDVALEPRADNIEFDSPDNLNCVWVTSTDDIGGLLVEDLAPFQIPTHQLPALFDGMSMRVRRIGAEPPPNLRINAMRIRVVTECGPITPPAGVIVDRSEVCFNDPGQVTLTAVGGEGEDVVWYAHGCGIGSPIRTGNPITIDSPTVTTTYYARRQSACAGITTCAGRQVQVIGPPVRPERISIDRPVVCSDDSGSITLQVHGGSGDGVRWFVGSCNGPEIHCCGSSITIPSPTVTTCYFARWERCGAFSSCATVCVEVRESPMLIGSCAPLTATRLSTASMCFDISGSAADATFRWHRNGTPLTDGGRISGATTRCLTIQGVVEDDAGAYHLAATTACGTTSSCARILTVCNLAIDGGPANAETFVGESLELCIAASGDGPLSYQWRKNGQHINDGGRFAGVHTPCMTIHDAMHADEGSYDCLVTSACAPQGQASGATNVMVWCRADFNRDEVVNSQDLFDFVAAFFNGCVCANVNEDCCVNSQDFFHYLTWFFQGC